MFLLNLLIFQILQSKTLKRAEASLPASSEKKIVLKHQAKLHSTYQSTQKKAVLNFYEIEKNIASCGG